MDTLNKLVAEKIMGQRIHPKGSNFVSTIEPYTENDNAAFKVVDKMRSLGWKFMLSDAFDGTWQVRFFCGKYDPMMEEWAIEYFHEDKDRKVAICLAALKAIGTEIK